MQLHLPARKKEDEQITITIRTITDLHPCKRYDNTQSGVGSMRCKYVDFTPTPSVKTYSEV